MDIFKNTIVKCKYRCLNEVLLKDLTSHEANCLSKPTKCPWCKIIVVNEKVSLLACYIVTIVIVISFFLYRAIVIIVHFMKKNFAQLQKDRYK